MSGRLDVELVDRNTKIDTFARARQCHRHGSLGDHLCGAALDYACRGASLRVATEDFLDAVDVADIGFASHVELAGCQAASVHLDGDIGVLAVVASHAAMTCGVLIDRRPSRETVRQLTFQRRGAGFRNRRV